MAPSPGSFDQIIMGPTFYGPNEVIHGPLEHVLGSWYPPMTITPQRLDRFEHDV